MDLNEVDVLSRHPVPRHRLTVNDFHRLGDAGILGVDDRVELLEGQLVDMSPIGPRHAFTVDLLTRLLLGAADEKAWVRPQNPMALDRMSECQPDVVVLRPPWSGYQNAHPRPEDVLLLIEVADSSLETDSGAKRALYARAGICEFWIVDLTTNSVIVHRDSSGDRYTTVTRIEGSGALDIRALPGIAIPVALLFA